MFSEKFRLSNKYFELVQILGASDMLGLPLSAVKTNHRHEKCAFPYEFTRGEILLYRERRKEEA